MTDLDLLFGKWTVHVKGWTWEYEFQRDGRVSWRDVNSAEKGSGNWAATSKLVNMWWKDSKTRESWQRPLTASNDKTWYESSYFRGKYRIAKAGGAAPAPGPTPTPGPTDAEMVNRAFEASRASLRTALDRLRPLLRDANALANMDGLQRLSALTRLNVTHQRDIAVVSRRLLVPLDPGSKEFRDALSKAITLIEQNLALPNTIALSRNGGKCSNPKPAFAWTNIGHRPPDTELCTAWVNSRDDLRRDVITHEYFHTIGLADVEGVNTTARALMNANTLAQVVALVTDRTRQKNSDGGEEAVPPLPSP